jgi:hypothetical protein
MPGWMPTIPVTIRMRSILNPSLPVAETVTSARKFRQNPGWTEIHYSGAAMGYRQSLLLLVACLAGTSEVQAQGVMDEAACRQLAGNIGLTVSDNQGRLR